MSQFAGLVVKDSEGNPEVFDEDAADRIIQAVTEPEIEKVSLATGGFYVMLK